MLATVVGAYYYLAIVKVMYFDEAAEGFYAMPVELRVVLAICGLFNILFFVYPGPLVTAASAAARSLF
jgi:NADH-quinone oxidoreductase subunit N